MKIDIPDKGPVRDDGRAGGHEHGGLNCNLIGISGSGRHNLRGD